MFPGSVVPPVPVVPPAPTITVKLPVLVFVKPSRNPPAPPPPPFSHACGVTAFPPSPPPPIIRYSTKSSPEITENVDEPVEVNV
jgi:hypothetical protein